MRAIMPDVGSRIAARLLGLALVLGSPAEGMAAGTRSPSTATSGCGPIHVLFIGNSLTYTNDLPGTLQALAALGNRSLSCASVTRPGYALIDHLDGGSDAVDVIRQGGWQYVILQQGPSSLPDSRVILIDGTVRFDAEIRAAGAVTCLYMVWPDKSRLAYFEAVRENYMAAADTVGGLFLPAGEAWLTAWESDPSIVLYGPDDFHPAPLGTFLVALVMYERLTGSDARDLPPIAVVAGDTLSVPERTVRILQSAAHATNSRYQIAGIEDSQARSGSPMHIDLRQNYPNPFNPSTTIGYSLPAPAHVTMKIYDVFGEEVATAFDGERQAGDQSTEWSAKGFASGVYYYRLTAGSFHEARKMLLVK